MVDINKYIDIENQVTLNGERGYYVKPQIIIHILMDELNLDLTYEELENFFENAQINITEEEIKEYLKEKQEKENPNLYEEYEKVKPSLKSLLEWQDEPDLRLKKALELESKINRYRYDAYTYKYYNIMITRLKNKCMKFAILIDYLVNSRYSKMNEEQLKIFVHKMEQFDIDVNEFGIHYNDVLRIIEPLLYNITKLKEYFEEANKLETYETEKKSILLHEIQKSGNLENSLYPTSEIQIQDISYDGVLGLIPFTKRQREKLMNKKVADLSKWFDDDEPLVKRKTDV